MQHKHHDLIVQWAADTSLKVEVYNPITGVWIECAQPSWVEKDQYRIKQKTQKVKLLAWYGNHSLHWSEKHCIPPYQYTRVPSEDKEIEVEL